MQQIGSRFTSRLAEMGVPGFLGIVDTIDEASPFSRRLREMGIREGEELEWVSGQDPVLLRCGSSRLAVCREMLAAVFVCRRHPAAVDCADKESTCARDCGWPRRLACGLMNWIESKLWGP